MPRMPSTQTSDRSRWKAGSRGMLLRLRNAAAFLRAAEPGLEHQDRPDGAGSIAPARKHVLPPAVNARGIEPALLPHPRRVQQVLRPIAKVAAEPFAHGH